MPNISVPSITSYEARKKEEEYAIQHGAVGTVLPQVPIHQSSSLSLVPLSVSATSKTSPPLGTPQPHTIEPLFKKLDEISRTPVTELQSIDVLFFEIMKIMEQESSSASKSRERLLIAQKEWQHCLEKQMLHSSEKARQAQNTSSFFTRISQALGPLSVIAAGSFALATGGVGIVALSVAAIGALLFLDCLLDDAAKKSIASLLARGDKESQESWLQRIRLVSSVVSMCLNMGTSIPQAIQIAQLVSQTTLEGLQAGYTHSKDTAKAKLLELKTSFEVSKDSSDQLLQKWEQIVSGVLERYQLFMSVQKARSESLKQIIQHL